MDHALLECYLGFWLITYCNGVSAYCTSQVWYNKHNTMSVMSSEKYMELVFLCKNSIGQVRCNQPKHHLGDFLQKTKMDIVFLLVVPFRFGTISKTCLT